MTGISGVDFASGSISYVKTLYGGSGLQAKNTEYLEAFGMRLKAAMARRSLRLRDVADACAVAVSTVGAWTQGKNWPDTELQPKLSQLVGEPIDYLLHGITGTDSPENVHFGQARSLAPKHRNEDLVGAGVTRLRERFQAMINAAGGDTERLGWLSVEICRLEERTQEWLTAEEENVQAAALSMTMRADHLKTQGESKEAAEKDGA
jgi:transcriptional regulator with XRE-family HTH domain